MRPFNVHDKYKQARANHFVLPELWTPHPINIPQQEAYYSDADEMFFGGSAGTGKSDLLIGLGVTTYHKSIIYRREYPQIKGLLKRSKEIIGDYGRYNGANREWVLKDGRTIEFGAVQYAEDVDRFQGRDFAYIGFDELCHFEESQFQFLTGWNRSANPNVKCRVVATGNPPTHPSQVWVIKRYAPWLDKRHANPAKSGEIRWFAVIDGKSIEVKDNSPIDHVTEKGIAETIIPRSRCFVRGNLKSNVFLAGTNYESNLQSLPEPLRSQLLYGEFTLAMDDPRYQVLPTQWVLDAVDRWNNRIQPPIPQSSIGCDPSRGGKDNTCIAIRYDDWISPIITQSGAMSPDGIAVAKAVIEQIDSRSLPYVNVDSIGIGGAVLDALIQFNVDAYGINVSNAVESMDRGNHYGFKNLRAFMWWNLRELLDPSYGATIAIPDDADLIAELCAPLYHLNNYKIQVESKDDIRKRIGRSTDRADALLMSLLPSGRRISGLFSRV